MPTFIDPFRSDDAPLLRPLQNERSVVASEPEGVRYRNSQAADLPGLVRHVVEVAHGVWRFVVDRLRQDAGLQAQRCRGAFDSPGAAHAVPGHGLLGTDGQLWCMLAKSELDRQGLV